ncbi:MAG: hypothetical protein ACO4CG_04485 [Prochlorothrix sp.]|nr:hypothetical protein [Prochlorothrix sp.]
MTHSSHGGCGVRLRRTTQVIEVSPYIMPRVSTGKLHPNMSIAAGRLP